jgi:cell division GTPase FtsZ
MSDENEEQMKSMYDEISADISMPDDLVPPPQEEAMGQNIIDDEVEVAFKFCFIGAGQGGSRIAESFHRLGYRRIAAINTAKQDLKGIKLANKLCIGSGGAGKDPDKAEKLIVKNRDDVIDFLRHSFGDTFDRIFVCAGAGGGTGGGTFTSLVGQSLEVYDSLGMSDKRVGLILTLPKASEGKKVNNNAHRALKEAWDMVIQDKVSPLIILDNERFGQLYPNLTISKFWSAANSNLSGLFHLFNMTAAKDSSYSSFDRNDYKNVLDSGLIVLGASPVQNWKDPVSVSRALRENLGNNMLCSDLPLHTGSCAAAIMIGGNKQLDNITQSTLDKAFEQLNRMLIEGSVVHRGIYSGDKDGLNIFTAVGGLGRPEKKLLDLENLAH